MTAFKRVRAAWNCKVAEGKKQLRMYYTRVVWLDEEDPVQRTIMREWQTYRDAERHTHVGEDAGERFEGSDVPTPAATRRNSDKRRIQKLLDQPSKFGRCPVHGAMLQPHVHKGGKQAGAIRCYCRRWFNWQQAAKRCW